MNTFNVALKAHYTVTRFLEGQDVGTIGRDVFVCAARGWSVFSHNGCSGFKFPKNWKWCTKWWFRRYL